MALRYLLCLLLGLICQVSHGQAVPGYVVTAGQDSLLGAINIRDDLAQQSQVDFITLQGNQRLLLNPSQLKAYGYISKQDTVRYVAIELHKGKQTGAATRIFLRRLLAGPVELYHYYYTHPANGPTAPNPNGTPIPRPTAALASHAVLYAAKPISGLTKATSVFPPLSVNSARFGAGNSLLLRRHNPNTIVEITWWNFPVDAATYFADYPALADDLRTKRYKAKDIALVLKRYNAWLSTNSPQH